MGVYNIVGKMIAATLAPVYSLLAAPSRRGLKSAVDRDKFLAPIRSIENTLEIGPFYAPLLPNACYFDVLNRQQLRSRAAMLGFDNSGCPEIDYVSAEGDLTIVDRTFDAVLSSHAIEHQPDFVSHLQIIEQMLTSGGKYYLIIPDKRYCMDHFTPESQLADICQAHLEKRKFHSAASIIRHHFHVTHNRAVKHWIGIHGQKPERFVDISKLNDGIADWQNTLDGLYVDVHGWRFTPEGFAHIIAGLNQLGWVDLRLTDIHDTKFGTQEFFAILERP